MIKSGYRFSKRTAWDVGESEFAAAIKQMRELGAQPVDLTVTNPTVCEFVVDPEAILGPLQTEAGLVYDPDARGMRSARAAVARYYVDHSAAVSADGLVLTTSTSEAYSYLFRLLCDGGDEVLVAQPSYPLFDFLADLDDVRLRPYPLFYDFGWWIDFAELERRIGPRTKAILVVHPNNPTGHWTHRAERQRLEEICARHGLALIVDEVFLDYPVAGEGGGESFAVGPHPVLTFVLSGMSKVAALPQMKVAWLAGFGPEEVLREALGRLEVIADTFLSMSAPVQLALPRWLEDRAGMQGQIRRRVEENLASVREAGLEMLRVEAGWAAVLWLRGAGAADVAMALLERAGVIVHPGAFYGLQDRRMVVVSLLTAVEVFRVGLHRIAGFDWGS